MALQNKKAFWLTAGIILFSLILPFTQQNYAQAKAEKPIILRYNDYGPPGRALMEPVLKWAAEVEKRTNGNVKIQFYHNGALATAKEIPDAMKAGAFEMGLAVAAYYPAKAPFDQILTLPFLMGGTASEFAEKWTKVIFDYYDLPPVKKQWASLGLMPLLPQLVPPYEILTVKPINSIDELKGLRMQARGFYARVIEEMGASAMSMPPTDTYVALQRGTLDGALSAPSTVLGYRYYEVAKGYLRVPLGGMLCNGIISLDAWNKLGPDNQRIMLEVRNELYPQFAAEANGASESKALETMKKSGVKIVEVAPGTIHELAEEYAKPLWEKILQEETIKKNLPYREVLNDVLKAKKKYGAP